MRPRCNKPVGNEDFPCTREEGHTGPCRWESPKEQEEQRGWSSAEPLYDRHGVAMCSDVCRQYDGKRCAILGSRPTSVCEPHYREVAMALAEAIPALRRFVDTAPLDPANVHGQLSERVALIGYLDDLQTLTDDPVIIRRPDVPSP